jgi:hypothetical protein
MIINDSVELSITDNLSASAKISDSIEFISLDVLNACNKINDNIELLSADVLNTCNRINDNIELLSADNLKNAVKITDQVALDFIDILRFKIKIQDELFRQGKQYTYNEIIIKFHDLSKIVDNFLPDWYTLRYLQKESILDRASVARVAIALSNLLRLAVENEIDEIHYVTLRIRKIFIEEVNKDVFVITDY